MQPKLTGAPNVPPEFAYGYDAANNRLFERRVHQPSASNWKGERYSYDAVYRLISRTEADVTSSGSLVGTPPPTQTFTLDGLGNWNSHTKDGTTYTNSVNALNQYTQFQGPQGTRDLSYDFAGNVTSEGTGGATYAYDFANRLVTSQSPGGTVAIYTDHGKPVHIISKVTIRMKKWMLYVLPTVEKP